jgi:hypothetical protein
MNLHHQLPILSIPVSIASAIPLSPFAQTLLTLIRKSAIARPELNGLLSRDGFAHELQQVAIPTFCTVGQHRMVTEAGRWGGPEFSWTVDWGI